MTDNREEVIQSVSRRVKVMSCSNRCSHEFQDRTYKGMRVFNAMGSPAIKGWRCTVCAYEVARN